MKTPLFWLQLRHQPIQTLSAIVGIAFITAFLFAQIGFRSSFLTTLVHLPNRFDAEIVMYDSSLTTALRSPHFSHHRLYQTLAYDEVVSVAPLYLGVAQLRDPAGSSNFLDLVQVIGVPIGKNALLIPEVEAHRDILSRRRSALIDVKSRNEFSPIINFVQDQGTFRTEMRTGTLQSALRIEALFSLGSNTSSNAHVIISDVTFMEVFIRDRGLIDMGLIKLKPGVDADQFVQRLQKVIPKDVRVLSKTGLVEKEWRYWEFNTPVGTVFFIGVAVAIGVGVIILYQILYMLITRHIRDYATLKAIGFSNAKLHSIVLKSALFLACAGFGPGLAISFWMYSVTEQATSLEFQMSPDRISLVFGIICSICILSALLAVRKLRDADPADLFG